MVAFSSSVRGCFLGWRLWLLALLVGSSLGGGAVWGQQGAMLSTAGGGGSYSSNSILILNPPVNPYPGPYVPPPPPREVLQRFPMQSGVLVLPQVSPAGVVELDATETLPFPMNVVGKNWKGENRFYTWDTHHWVGPLYSIEEGLVLRCYWNGERISSFTAWFLDGNPGKGGTYRMELWQSELYRQAGPVGINENNVRIYGETYKQYKYLSSVSFQVVIRDHTPLPAGEPPVFTELPELPVAPEVTVMPEAGVTLRAMANAGGAFQMTWYKDGAVVSRGSELRVLRHVVDHVGTEYYCEASGPTGVARTPVYRLRLPVPVSVDFTASERVVRVGGTVRLVPGVTVEPGVTFSWSGPALTAGYAGARVLEDGTLEIHPARLEDAGRYDFTVANAEASMVHPLEVKVVQLPEGVYSLRVGKGVPLPGVAAEDGLEWPVEMWTGPNAVADAEAAAARRLAVTWQPVGFKQGKVPGFTWDKYNQRLLFHEDYWEVSDAGLGLRKVHAGMAGMYRCVVQDEWQKVPKSFWGGRYWYLTIAPGREFLAESLFELRSPWERPVMPAHALPPGRVGADYAAAAPVTEAGAATAAVTYRVTGLPRGLKAGVDGTVTGRPLKSGEFRVKFVAVNARGAGAALEVPMSIAPLPVGTVGDWLVFGEGRTTQAWDSSRYRLWLTFKITPTGAFSGRGPYGAVKGQVEVDAQGVSWMRSQWDWWPEVRIAPGTDVAETLASLYFPAGRGWRNVWSVRHPAKVSAGRYNFQSGPLPGLQEGQWHQDAGYRSGSTQVMANGRVMTVATGEEARASTSSYFLGPQRQVLHRMQTPILRTQSDATFLELAIDESGQEIQGQQRVYKATFKSPTSTVFYSDDEPGYSWPEGVVRDRVYVGRLYTPPAAGSVPAGYALPGQAASVGADAAQGNAELMVVSPWIQYDPFDDTFTPPTFVEVQPWVLGKGGRLRAAVATETMLYPATCQVKLGTGLFKGKVLLKSNFYGLKMDLLFQGFLVPEPSGALVGYGAAYNVETQYTLPVMLRPRGE